MTDRAVVEIGQCGEANVRMRAHIHAAAGREIDRAEMIEEHKRTDLPSQAERQQTPNDETIAEIVQAGLDDKVRCASHGNVPGEEWP